MNAKLAKFQIIPTAIMPMKATRAQFLRLNSPSEETNLIAEIAKNAAKNNCMWFVINVKNAGTSGSVGTCIALRFVSVSIELTMMF
ncbi:hypothetical protein MCAMS1_01831 [biofilm metagenome]